MFDRTKNINRRDFLRISALTPLIWLAGRHLARLETSTNTGESAPNILVLVFDALSARHMSLYGYPRQTTPNFERFAQKANVYHKHYSAGTFTIPGTTSLLTGVYPWTHRALHLYGTPRSQFEKHNIFAQLETSHNTFAYTHNSNTYVLLNFLSKHIDLLPHLLDLSLTELPQMDKMLNFDFQLVRHARDLVFRSVGPPPSSLFGSFVQRPVYEHVVQQVQEEYGQHFPSGLPEAPFMSFTLEHTFNWLQRHLTQQPTPFFGYFHVFPPHDPYRAREEFIGKFEDGWKPVNKPKHFFDEGWDEVELLKRRGQYDEFLAYADAEFGRLYDSLNQSGLLENTCLVVTSDHGEMFERGIWAHLTSSIFQPLLHIPLLISLPGQQQRQDIHIPTSSVDVLPTLLHVAGQDAPEWCEGQILPSHSRDLVTDRSVYALDAKLVSKEGRLNTSSLALIKEHYELVHYQGYPGYEDMFELYDLENDPEEMHNLYDPRDALSKSLQEELTAKLAEIN